MMNYIILKYPPCILFKVQVFIIPPELLRHLSLLIHNILSAREIAPFDKILYKYKAAGISQDSL